MDTKVFENVINTKFKALNNIGFWDSTEREATPFLLPRTTIHHSI